MSSQLVVPSDEEDNVEIQHFHEMGLDDRILKVGNNRFIKSHVNKTRG